MAPKRQKCRTEYKSVTNGAQNMWLCFLYDSQGRRFEKKVTVAGTTTLHHRCIYHGYLQIAALDLTRSAHPALWIVTWDPSQPIATRLLAIQKDGNWFTYGYDLTKNICEVFGPAGYIRTTYSYAPFGSVTASGDVTQPFQWSSEHYDSELDLVYYNYRHYSPSLGRFLSRDPIEEQGGRNLYAFVKNKGIGGTDLLGQSGFPGFSPISGNNLQCRAYDMIYSNRGRCRPCSEGGIECRTNRPSGIPPSLNGCGSKDSEWVPDSFFGIVSFTEACNKHDVCYGTCGANKADCDKGLREDMASACDKKFGNSKFVLWQLYLLCLAQAQIYESALLLAGSAEIAFEEGQDIACAWEKIPCMF